MATKKTVKATSKKTTTSAAPARQRRRSTSAQQDQAGGASAVEPAQIANLAYRYFEESGRVHGHDLEHWLRAEQELRGTSLR